MALLVASGREGLVTIGSWGFCMHAVLMRWMHVAGCCWCAVAPMREELPAAVDESNICDNLH